TLPHSWSFAEERSIPGHLSFSGVLLHLPCESANHNSPRLVSGKERCTLQIHPDDAAARGVATGGRVALKSRVGEIVVPAEVTDAVMPGVVSLPHGWGHDRPGVQMRVASAHPGASANDVTDDAFVDALAGTAVLSGVPVEVAAVE
ncbi:MAG: dehydrogenase, partial [Proteobacteria bacterium]